MCLHIVMFDNVRPKQNVKSDVSCQLYSVYPIASMRNGIRLQKWFCIPKCSIVVRVFRTKSPWKYIFEFTDFVLTLKIWYISHTELPERDLKLKLS